MDALLTSPAENVSDPHWSLLALASPEIVSAPDRFYRALREFEPVHWDPYMHAWVVTGYREVVTVLGNGSAERSPAAEHLERLGLSFFRPFAETMARQMLFIDGPLHTRLRGLCSTAFTMRRIEELRAVIERTANELIDRVVPAGRLEMIGDFAGPLPSILTTQLMGVPADDHRQLGKWVNDLAEVHGNFQHHPDRVAEVLASLRDLKIYLADRISDLRRCPNDGLISSLLSARFEGEHLSDDEVIANAIVMIIGGHETTTNLIASGFLTLLRNPVSYEELLRHPERIGAAVEELLRYESPVQHTARIAAADMRLAGKNILQGSRIIVVLAAANRDPARFPDPDRLDFERSDNRHLAFGWGHHACFGAALARAEGQIALSALLRRLHQPFLLDDVLEWRQNVGLRGLTRLQIGFQSGANPGKA